MTRLIALLLLLATPALAQDAVPAADPGPSADPGAAGESEGEGPADPVAAWEADPTAILDAAALGPEGLGAFEFLARPLVIFADSPRDPRVEEQLRLIERDLGELTERDVAVILDTDPDAGSAVREELRPRGFAVVLVDKDGRVTRRQPGLTAVREIARAIDRTPIRQEELRLGRGGEAAEE